MARIPVNIVRGKRASPRVGGSTRTPKSPAQKKEESEAARKLTFKKSGCTQQYPECPEVPDFEHSECKSCPHFPNKYKK